MLDFILRHRDEHGAPPTRAEMVTACGFRSPTAAEDHLRALARKGAIDLRAGASRGIRVLADVLPAEAANEARHDALEDRIPLVGRVAAGMPMLATESIEAHYKLDRPLFHPDRKSVV